MVTNMDDVEEQLDIIFKELFSADQVNSKITAEKSDCLEKRSEVKEANNRSIYDILNTVPESRKTLNILLQKFDDLHEPIKVSHKGEYSINKSLLQECFSVSELWEQEEKKSRFSTSSSNITLQVELPITFAWSNKSSQDIVKEVMRNQEKKDKMEEIQSNIQLPTVLQNIQNCKFINETLLKEVNENLVELTKHTRSWHYILQRNEEQEISDLQKLDNGSLNGESAADQKPENFKPNFQVDPLEKFVVTSLPRVKKDSTTKNESKKAKSKSKSFRWIWNSSTKQKHKNKEKHNDKNKQSDKDNELMDIVRNSDYNSESINCTIPSVENGRYTSETLPMDVNETPKEELDFDLDIPSSLGSNELSSMKTEKQIAFDLNITTGGVNKNNNKCTDRNNIELVSENVEDIQTSSINLQNSSNDSDDDFGEFEISDTGTVVSKYDNILIPSNPRDKSTSLIDDDNISFNITNTSTDKPIIPNMMSFIPLQPQKRS